jgi:glucosamine--fructose-6-phosphate aminotransferase (isomerizing)
MCGISAILGKNAYSKLIESLEQLQNRGYDSAGISIMNDNIFETTKFASIENESALEKLKEHNIKGNIGIAHTRWATHGAKTDENSHPHISMNKYFTIVHNGIIENFQELKDFLINEGYSFASQTDSEVISNLLDYNLSKLTHDNSEQITIDVINTVIKTTLNSLQGTWGLAILCSYTPNSIYCTRHGSPLLISNNDNIAMIVSEQSGFCKYANNYIVLDNHDICTLTLENNKIDMKFTDDIDYKKSEINMIDFQLTPEPFEHWTLKEIYEQTESSLRAISMGGRLIDNNIINLGGLNEYKEELQKIDNIIFLGCGTSYHAGMLGVYYFKEINEFNNVQLFDGAEFQPEDIPKIGNTAFILLSQSGETKDLHRCIEIGKDNNCFLIGVVNVPDSMISREVNCGCYLNAGREVAVASTKSFTSQVIILIMMSYWFNQNINEHQKKCCIKKQIDDLRSLNHYIGMTIKNSETFFTEDKLDLFNHHSCFILGKGKCEAIAREGSLKIKEISYIHSEAYSSSGLKHGPFALLEPGFPVVLLNVNEKHSSKNKNAYEEIKSRHANIITITTEDNDDPYNLVIPKNCYSELLSVIPLQILAYKLSIKRGINPDMPKNLAKVVTVE